MNYYFPRGKAKNIIMNISILGCGWLGFSLGKRLIEEKHFIKGSTTNQEKVNLLIHENITPYLLKLYPEGIQGDITAFLAEADMLIVNIPPGLRKDPGANFIGKIDSLQPYIAKSPVKKLIFISSTTVYKDTPDFPIYTEEDIPNGTSKAAIQLISAENQLKASDNFATIILRFGGLIGPGRHPVKNLAGKSGIKNPRAPVNLIHRQDCIEIITELIKKEFQDGIYNAVYPYHPEKAEYYTKIAREKHMALPEFDNHKKSEGKTVNPQKLIEQLEFEFKYKI